MRAFAAALLVATPCTLFLQGCGGGGGDDPGDNPDVPPQGEWKLNPIVVKGQHMYDVVTDKPFYPRGLGFPNCGEDISKWIAVLERIHTEAPSMNLVRIYEPPSCAFDGKGCWKQFMKRADDLGIYVLMPGTGTQWGYLPIVPSLFDDDPQKAYEMGGVLGFGQKVLQYASFPNLFAIVVGNEFDQKPVMRKHLGVMKAYVRDLREHMKTCNTDSESPTKGAMRRIPLMYASSDDGGDALVKPKADYLFCDDESGQVDIFGLNLERWCADDQGKKEYDNVNKYVADAKYPGAFFIAEDGCTKTVIDSGIRSWAQTQGFFKNFPAFSGYAAYTYYGNPDFDMFDSAEADATMNEDGANFFRTLIADVVDVENSPDFVEVDPATQVCPAKLGDSDLEDWKAIKWYDTGEAHWAKNCPQPYGSSTVEATVV